MTSPGRATQALAIRARNVAVPDLPPPFAYAPADGPAALRRALPAIEGGLGGQVEWAWYCGERPLGRAPWLSTLIAYRATYGNQAGKRLAERQPSLFDDAPVDGRAVEDVGGQL